MCSISGVSFVPGSTLPRQKIAAALLREGESRGRDASGYAWVAPSGDGVYKKALPGGKLHVGKIPTDATAIIMHTRQATHGHESDPTNNHPVVSPEGEIRLVHNGVIYNHMQVRDLLGKVGKGLPDVDSSVIPAIMETYGIDATSELAGYAACAWFDRETDDTIHLAKFKTSPVHFATLWDGSFAFASTPEILGRALNSAGVAWFGAYPQPFESLSEGEYLQILGGEVIVESEVLWKQNYTHYGYDYSDVTSGKASMSDAAKSESPWKSDGIPSQKEIVAMVYADDTRRATEEEEDEHERWLEENTRAGLIVSGGDPELYDEDDDEEEGEWNAEDLPLGYPKTVFYTMDHSGDFVTYPRLKELVANLVWSASLTGGEDHLVGPEAGTMRWVNHIADLGVLSDDGDDQISWVKDNDEFEKWTMILDNHVRDGVQKLRQLVGA